PRTRDAGTARPCPRAVARPLPRDLRRASPPVIRGDAGKNRRRGARQDGARRAWLRLAERRRAARAARRAAPRCVRSERRDPRTPTAAPGPPQSAAGLVLAARRAQ